MRIEKNQIRDIYDLYLKGRFIINKTDFKNKDIFEQYINYTHFEMPRVFVEVSNDGIIYFTNNALLGFIILYMDVKIESKVKFTEMKRYVQRNIEQTYVELCKYHPPVDDKELKDLKDGLRIIFNDGE